MKKILKFLSYVLVIRIVFNLFNENTTIKEQIDKLKEEITNLEITDLDKKIKDFQNNFDGFKDNNQDILGSYIWRLFGKLFHLWPRWLVKLVTKIHTRLIRFNHTKIGSIILGGNILLLETKGRNTNLIRKVPLTYVELSDSYLVAASYGGRDVHPEWFLNIQINNGNVVVNKKKYKIKAEIIPEDEIEKYWKKLIKIYPTFNLYRARSKRSIPLVKLIRI